MVLLSSTKLTIQGAMGEGTSVVGSEDDERVLRDANLLHRVEKLADLVIHVFDEGNVRSPFLG